MAVTDLSTRTAVVVAGAAPADLTRIGSSPAITMRENKLGTLVTGRVGNLVIDYASELAGPVYDIMYSAKTGWFAVTVYRGLSATRWDNRPGTNPGYSRVDDVLGATTPTSILDALDVPASVIGYAPA